MRDLFISWLIARRELFVLTAKKNLHGHLSSMAEDVAHDAMLKLLNRADSFKGSERQFDSYANRVVKSTCIDLSRKKESEVRPVSDSGFPESEDSSADGLILLIRKERAAAVRQALLKINKHYRQIILLKIRFDCSGKEIAERLNMDERYVSVYYQRGMKQLEEVLKNTI